MAKENKIKLFHEKYKLRGGFNVLDWMKEERFSTEYIGDHFGITRERVRQIIHDIYGIDYNPKIERKERIINSMLKFAMKHSPEEFREAYYYAGKHYYDIAIAEAYVRGIYKK